MKLTSRSAWAALLVTMASLAAQAQTLRIGLAEDPDVLDPTLARSFVGRIVFTALCDKLFDIDEKLAIVPQLATGESSARRLDPGMFLCRSRLNFTAAASSFSPS